MATPQNEDLKGLAHIPESCTYPTATEHYQLMEQIGSGMGGNRVFKALVKIGPHQSTTVAVKQIMINPSDNTEDLKEKMHKEIKTMQQAASPHICVFHCSIVADDCLWVVMKLAAGSLRDVLKWKFKTGFPEDDENALAKVLYEALQGLDVLHNMHIIHRDIKASNILFGEDGVITLADFGVSAILSNHEEKRVTMAGTWHWMAPEVIDPGSNGYDVQADIWSLGITTIELAYGEAPYGNQRATEVVVHISTDEPPSMENPHSPYFFKPKFSPLVSDFVSCCLQIDPTKRDNTKKLLTHKLFNLPYVKSNDNSDLVRVLITDMPSIEKRFEELQERRNNAIQLRFQNLNGAQSVGRQGGRGRPNNASSFKNRLQPGSPLNKSCGELVNSHSLADTT